jgi:hypothetical protein
MDALETTNYSRYPENFMELSYDISERAERISGKTRHFLGDLGIVKYELLMEMVAETHGMKVNWDGETFEITIPRLLPKTKHNHNSEFITQPLNYVLSKFCEQNKFEKLKKCAVCFIHEYDEKLALSRVRDYDNIETRNVLNLVSTYFLTDDSGRFCNVFHTTKYGESDCTRIFLMPQKLLPSFLLRLEDGLKEVSTFSDNL